MMASVSKKHNPHFFMLFGFWRLTGRQQYGKNKNWEKAVEVCRKLNAAIAAKKHAEYEKIIAREVWIQHQMSRGRYYSKAEGWNAYKTYCENEIRRRHEQEIHEASTQADRS